MKQLCVVIHFNDVHANGIVNGELIATEIILGQQKLFSESLKMNTSPRDRFADEYKRIMMMLSFEENYAEISLVGVRSIMGNLGNWELIPLKRCAAFSEYFIRIENEAKV